MTTARLSKEMLPMFAFCSLIALASIGAACGGGGAQQGPGGPGGAPPPMPVEIVTLAAKPVEQTTEYVATTKSLRSSTIQPEVEGFLTRIAVRSGERVTQGALLF
jgi:membrane fusion protein (multidrug efflux system)